MTVTSLRRWSPWTPTWMWWCKGCVGGDHACETIDRVEHAVVHEWGDTEPGQPWTVEVSQPESSASGLGPVLAQADIADADDPGDLRAFAARLLEAADVFEAVLRRQADG